MGVPASVADEHGRASPALQSPSLMFTEPAPRDGPALPAREFLVLSLGWRQPATIPRRDLILIYQTQRIYLPIEP